MEWMASSTWSQNAPRSDGSGNRSLARGVIYARIDFRSLAGRYVASELMSQGVWVWGCGT
jgi:hypothetical protein